MVYLQHGMKHFFQLPVKTRVPNKVFCRKCFACDPNPIPFHCLLWPFLTDKASLCTWQIIILFFPLPCNAKENERNALLLRCSLQKDVCAVSHNRNSDTNMLLSYSFRTLKVTYRKVVLKDLLGSRWTWQISERLQIWKGNSSSRVTPTRFQR